MTQAPPGGPRLPLPVFSQVKRLLVRVVSLPSVVQDSVLAVVLFGVTFGQGQLEGARGVALQTALVLPLVWRRRAPLTVFGVIAAVACVQWLLGVQLPADAALLIALGTVTARSPARPALVAVAVLEVGALMSAARWAPEGRLLASAGATTALVVASALLGANVRIRRRAQEDRVAHLERERDQRARLAVAEERARITREMHDSVTHNLSVITALADATVHTRPDDPFPMVDQIARTGRQALTDMRRSLGILRAADGFDAERHPAPGVPQLEALCAQVRAVGLPTLLRLDGDPAVVPAAAQLTAYRIVQESLTNTLRHTPPGTRAEVRVSCSPRAVTVEVSDDGPAVPAHPAGPPGRGLAGMRERAAAYGGTHRAGPEPGGGWRVFTRLDLEGTV
ncbi:histidine kinase [Streptomyces sp. NPDC004610]|uniref:sensor histidine kinase n=1 Tax=unclassified Streptomyces TaxID=2593676 RepID=UPI0033B257A8